MTRAVRVGSPAETKRLAARLGRLARAGDVIGLVGDLGAGKTCFVQGLAEGLGVPRDERIASPTFNIVLTHPGRVPLVHVDLYRLGSEGELAELGLEQLLEEGGVGAIEWLDRFPAVAPADHLDVRITIDAAEGPRARTITAESRGPRSEALLTAWISPDRPRTRGRRRGASGR